MLNSFFHLLGEPLPHKEVFEAIEYANSLDLSVSLYTNAALLDSKRATSLLQSLKNGVCPFPTGNVSLYIKHTGTWDNMHIPNTMQEFNHRV